MKSNSNRHLTQSDGKPFGLLEQFVSRCFSLHTSSLIVLSAYVLGYSVYPAQAEGTRDLTNNFQGDRPYTFWRNDTDSATGILRRTVIKVYAKAGEEINLGSSAVGIGQGRIDYRKPDGRAGSCNNRGLIQNQSEEAAGPLPAAGGYTPCRVLVGANEEGIWEIDFRSPNPDSLLDPPRDRLLASAAWTQPSDRGYILAWDATVFRSPDNRTPITGRVYTDYLSLNMGNSGRELRARTYVLTEDGYQYLTELNGVDPFGFFFFSNNKGFRDSLGDPLYRSVLLPSTGLTPPNYPNAPTPSFLRPDQPNEGINNYTNKLFINPPNADLPTSTRVATNGPNTWLLTPPLPPPRPNLRFRGIEGTENQTGTAVNNSNPPRLSGNFTFNNPARERPYQIIIDVNRDGIFGNANDRVLAGRARVGQNTVVWDARDGAGNPVPASRQAYGVQIYIFAGEVHFPYLDAENNPNGIIIQRLNAPAGFPLNSPDPFLIYYDDRVPGIQTGGGPSNPIAAVNGISSSNGAHRYGQLGNESGFGNNAGFDTWAYYPSEPEDLQIIVAAADLQVTKSVTPTTASPGGQVTYTVTFTNAGPNDVTGARVSDAVITGGNNIQIGNWTCTATGTGAACGAASGTGSFNTTLNLPNGTSATFTVTATVAAGATTGSTVVNRAQILRTNDTTDPNPENPDVNQQGSGNNVAEATLSIGAPTGADVVTTKTGPATVAGNGSITYTITARNDGPNEATNVVISDTLPQGVTFNSASDNGTNNNGVVTFPAVNIASGQSVTRTITVTAPASSAQPLLNTVRSTASTNDPTPNNNDGSQPPAQVQTTITAAPGNADVVTTKTGPATVAPNGSITYTITARNNGPEEATNVVISDTLPQGVTFGSASDGGTNNNGVVTFPAVNIASGQSVTRTITVTAPASSAQPLLNTVRSTANTPDPTPNNNDGSQPPGSQNPAQVQTTINTANTGTISGLAFNADNNNPLPGTTVTLLDANGNQVATAQTGPDGSYTFLNVPFGNNYSVSVPGNVPNPQGGPNLTTNNPNVGSINLDANNPNRTNVDFPYTAPPANTGTISGRAFNSGNNASLPGTTVALLDANGNQVATAQTGPDGSYSFPNVPFGNNYTVTVPTSVPNPQGGPPLTVNNNIVGSINLDANNPNRPNVDFPYQAPPPPPTVPDLTITKTAVGPFVVGQQGTYQLNVTNNGADTTGPIQIVDTLPNGMVFFGASGNGWSCTTTGQQQITCTNPNPLAAGASTTLTITVTSTQAGSGTNVADVSTPGETNTSNNRAEAPTTINNPPNQPPVANDDSSSTNPGVPVNIPVLGNDSDPDNNLNPNSVTIVTNPSNGTVTVNPDGTITYTPNPGFTNGTDTFVYQVCDTTGQCDTATVTVTVPAAAPQPPVAQDRSTSPLPNTNPIQVPPLLGTDPDGTVVTYTITNVPPAGQGTLLLNGQPVQPGQTLTPDQVSQLVLQPNPNFTGTVTFNYTVTDNQGLTSPPATVTIPVIAPGNQPPVAENRSTSPLPNTNPISVPQLIGRDPDGTVVTYTITTLPPAGQGTLLLNGQPVQPGQTLTPDQVGQLVLQPNPNFTGTVTFNYTVTDNQGLTSPPATVTIPVIAPTPTGVQIGDTVFNDLNGNGTQDQGEPGLPNVTVTLTLPGPDGILGNGDDTTQTTTTNNNGSYSFPNLPPGNYQVTVTPPPEFNSATTPVSQTINLNDNNNNVDFGLRRNPPPVVPNFTTSPIPNTGTPVQLPVLTANDPNGSVVSFTITTLPPPEQGVLFLGNPATGGVPVTPGQSIPADQIGNLFFQPNPNFTGNVTIPFTATDNQGGVSPPATLTIPVTPPAQPPVANNDVAGTNPGQPVTINPLINDRSPDGTPLNPGSLRIVSNPSNGTVQVNPDGTITYTPNPGFTTGTDSFVYEICDTRGACDTATVTVSVPAPLQQPPVASDDRASTNPNTPVVINVLDNDTDPNNNLNPVSVTIVTPPTNGTVSVNPVTGQITFTPNPGFNTGTDTFEYQVCDTTGQCDTATVTVSVPVTATNPPVANNDSISTNPNTPVLIDILNNDSDPDNNLNPRTVTIISNPANGTVRVNPDGTVTYTPNPGFTTGTDIFTYQVCDSTGLCDTATVTVTVPNPVPRPPVATNDSTSTNPGTPVLINVAANDRDPDGNLDPTTVQIVNQPQNGTVRIDPATGNIIYTPNPGFTTGTDTFTYRICDTTGLCTEATVTVTVPVATNNPLTANPDAIATNPNTPVTINILGNDSGNINPATLRIVTPPANGRVVINPDGTVTYIPNPGFTSGTDTFTYQICDTAGNCSETTVTIAVPQPSPNQSEIQVNLTGPTTPVTAGTNVTLNGVVTNNGPNIAQGVIFTFPLPAGVTFVSANPSQGTCVESNGIVTCNLGNLNPGQSVSIPIVVRPTQAQTINATATATAQNDAIVNNNTATVALRFIAGTPRVLLVKRITSVTSNGTTTNFTNFVDDPSTENDNASGWSRLRPVGEIQPSAPLKSGDIVEYTVYFLSDGSVPAQNVNFCDAIPLETTFIADGFGSRTGIQLNQGGTNSSLTNAQDSDAGTFFSPLSPLPNGNACAEQNNRNGSVILNLREIPNTPNGNVGFVRFRVTID